MTRVLQVGALFSAGLGVLRRLSPSDLEEVRRYREPPRGVVKVTDAVCLLFRRPPGWASARRLLGRADFLQVRGRR